MSIFETQLVNRPTKSVFNMSHSNRLTCDTGTLVPFFVKETYPGDVWKNNTSLYIRLQPMVAPIYAKIDAYLHFWFVPRRLVYEKFNVFLTGGPDGTQTDTPPYINLSQFGAINSGDLADYLGVPTGNFPQAVDVPVDMSVFRAYQLIYNEFYRDETLVQEVPITKNSGMVLPAELGDLTKLRQRAWRKDYFTSALPWAQRGPQVQLPLGNDAPVHMKAKASVNIPGGQPNIPAYVDTSAMVAGTIFDQPLNNITDDQGNLTGVGGLYADLSNATAATINELRRAIAVQKWLETNNRGGSRFLEALFAHFGVMNPDARLQRPEYLGGNIIPVQVSEIIQTSETNTTPQGNPSGRGIAVGQGATFKYHCNEHGFIIGLLSILPKASYSQGLPRMFSRMDKFDYMWPEFSRIGEQAILEKELYAQDAPAAINDKEFGYQERYSELKCALDEYHGDFRNTLDFWHAGRQFSGAPGLNQTFIEVNTAALQRNWTVANGHHFLCDFYNDCSALRCLPAYGTPSY